MVVSESFGAGNLEFLAPLFFDSLAVLNYFSNCGYKSGASLQLMYKIIWQLCVCVLNTDICVLQIHTVPAIAQMAAFKTDNAVIHIAVADDQSISEFFG